MKTPLHTTATALAVGAVCLFLAQTLLCCSSGGKRPASDDPDSGDTETESETEPLIDGEIPGWEMSWVVKAGGSHVFNGWVLGDRGDSVSALPDGSTFVTGNFTDSAVFGEGDPNETVLVNGGGDFDGFVARYAPNGELTWARRFGSEMQNHGFFVIAVDDGGGLVTGRIQDENVFFEGAQGETTVTSPAGYENGFFVARFDGAGNLLWVTTGGHPDGESLINAISPIDDSSAIVAGTFQWRLTYNEGTPLEETIDAYWAHDVFVASMSLVDGSIEWLEKVGGEGDDHGGSLALLSDDSFVFLGSFGENALLGEGQPNETYLECKGSSSLFLAKYGLDGALIWARDVGVDGSVPWKYSTELSVTDGGDGFVIASGFRGKVVLGEGTTKETVLTANPDGRDIFLAKFLMDGNLEWAKQIHWVSERQGKALAGEISVMPGGNITLCGAFEGAIVFGVGEPNETTLPDPLPGGKDIFVSLFNPDGSLEWAVGMGGSFDFDFAFGVDTLDDDTFFVTGMFGDEAVFGTSAADAVLMSADGSADMFLMKLNKTTPTR